MKSIHGIMLGAYLAFWFGISFSLVGSSISCANRIVDMWFPVHILTLFAIPGALGYAAGKRRS